MTAVTSYATLQTAVAEMTWRTDITALIPGFIQSFEGQVSRRLVKDGPVRNMLGRSDASITTEFTAIPTDFLGPRALYLGANTYQQMTYVEPEKIVERKSLYPNFTGDPQIYSIVGPEIQLWPWAAGNASPYTAELTYWRSIPALSDSNTTNWLLTTHPDCYLYGVCFQAAVLLKDNDAKVTFAPMAEAIIQDIIDADKVARWAPQLQTTIVPGGTFDGPRAYYP